MEINNGHYNYDIMISHRLFPFTFILMGKGAFRASYHNKFVKYMKMQKHHVIKLIKYIYEYALIHYMIE